MSLAPPLHITASVHARLPDALRVARHSGWSLARGAGVLHSFLEGPAFDRHGYLFMTDVCHGRILRLSPEGEWSVFSSQFCQPNGIAIHRDGRLFVADQALGIVALDTASGDMLQRWDSDDSGQRLRAPNDLVFAANGDLLFTDPGHSALDEAHGCVYRLPAGGMPTRVLGGLPFPNGLALMQGEDALCLAVTRSLQVLRARWQQGRASNLGVYVQLSGGLAGPDGLACAADGSLAIAHSGLGVVWLCSPLGEVAARIQSPAGIRTTNVAFGVDDPYELFITESEHGVVLKARLPVAGLPLFSHAQASQPQGDTTP